VIEFLKHTDIRLFLYLNSKHIPFIDELMFWTSKEYTWIPFYLFLLYRVWKSYFKKTLLVLLCTALLITLSDQLSVHFFKELFLRYRPTHNLLLLPYVHTVHGYTGGLYGFVSSHAANTFALATFVSLLLHAKQKKLTWVLLIWASVVSYSRIYLGVHYPLDVMGGALLGSALAYLIYKLYLYLDSFFFHKPEMTHE
jgi:undecaprenyl-diphosphatase